MKGRQKSGSVRAVLSALLVLVASGAFMVFAVDSLFSLGLGLMALGSSGLLWVWYWQTRRVIQSLQRNRQRLREAQRLARIGSWELDLDSGRLYWSQQLFDIFEIDPAQGPADYGSFLGMVHPDDRERVDAAYQQSLSTRQAYEVDHRLLMPDGRIKQIREKGESFFDAAGKPIRSIGTAQDITEQHHLESQMRLLGVAFHHSGEAIMITDHENRIVTVNPAFTQLTGYTRDEVVGQNPSILSAGRTSRADYERMWSAITQKGYWQGEIWDRRKDGGVYPKWLSISVMRDELGEIRYHIAHFSDVSAERAAEAKLHHMAHHDMLTGLSNRHSLKDRLGHALAKARREGTRVALLFIDLDRFKNINDTLGHHVGDELLISVSQRLRQCVRESDLVARLGGDEFVVMLPDLFESESVASVAEKIVDSVGEPYPVGPHTLYTTPSVGIAIYPDDGADGESLMRNADAAMYHAKSAGRNNFQFFDARMNAAAVERLNIEHALRHALSREEFRLHFQPVIDIRTGRVASIEALVRWQHPERGLLAPGFFIGVAEETGLIQAIGDWVLWAACRQLADFRDAGISDVKMAINISALQLRNGNLPVLAQGIMDVYSLQEGDLIFEITESVAMERPEETVRILEQLHRMGVQLALDDFGTGYSSLSYLKMFALDTLKLDRSFVEEIGVDADGEIICDATIGLAHSLRLRLVAEGVETAQQLDYLQARGCNFVQGYLFSRPLPAEQVLEFIKARNT